MLPSKRYPDGVFDFVVRAVADGHIKCHKDDRPHDPLSWPELFRVRLTPAQSWVSLTELQRYYAPLLDTLRDRARRENEGC